MNHKLWAAVGARVIAVSFVIAGVAACDRERMSDASSSTSASATATRSNDPNNILGSEAAGTPSASAQVIGTVPAPASQSGDTAQTATTTDLTKHQQTTGPQEGNTNSYSTLSEKTPQKADGENHVDQRSTPSSNTPADTADTQGQGK